MRVLVLGGTGEGRALAERLAPTPGVEVVSSLAGRVTDPRLPAAGDVRIGGFGDVDGLAAYLGAERIDAVVDATHPFAVRITANAAAACSRRGVPLLVLRRPGWTATPDDDWHRVPDVAAAASAVAARPPGAVLLTLGRRGPAAFAGDATHPYVIRCIDPPGADEPLPPRRTIVLARGPFTADGETALLRRYAIALLVTKESGGDATVAELTAARGLRLPVVMIDRPPLPPGPASVDDVAAAAAWIASAAAHRAS